MPNSEVLYAPRFRCTELLERGRANVITCPVYRDGVLVVPASASVTVKNPDGTTLATPSATVSSSVATATVLAASLSALSYGVGYSVEWALVMPDGTPRTFDNRAAIVRRALAPVISDADLTALHPEIARQLPSGTTTYQAWIDEAWWMIQNRLLGQANRANLILEPYALRECHRYLALHLVFSSGVTSRGERQRELAAEHRANYENEWGQLSFAYGSDDSGVADGTRRRSAQSQTFLAEPEGPSSYPFGWGR